ncbi:hypothetical protein Acid345_2111 [Candidatus Koribacter versatilis Ellin345]|uniref:Uncharacterized protein n=1 Tax=Koribacter versatilis (strain Ellin345) TaxID=204669 RepID=Q1IPT8_KORVE|nr:hypothetical protein [Candidatus Koribacter versatilis]ABF41112.1 hypothetical protein Acid345_2111 [Candidatus Koribacter versatilis Ellin345]
MGLDIGGYETQPDWPRMGPSFLIATCLIVAIRTARWSATDDSTTRDLNLDHEITFAATLTARVFAHLLRHHPTIFPSTQKPWYKPDGEDQPK